MLEYAIAAAALFLAAAAAAAVVGAKVGGLIGLSLQAAPGTHPTDHANLAAKPIIELTEPSPIAPDLDAILDGSNSNRLDETFGTGDGTLEKLVLPPDFDGGGTP